MLGIMTNIWEGVRASKESPKMGRPQTQLRGFQKQFKEPRILLCLRVSWEGLRTSWESLRTNWEGLGSSGVSFGDSLEGLRASSEGLRANWEGIRTNWSGMEERTDGNKNVEKDPMWRCHGYHPLQGRCPKGTYRQ